MSHPFTHLDVAVDLEERDLVHLAERRDQSLVLLVVTVLREETQPGIATINSFGDLI